MGAPKGTYPGGLTSLPELNPVLRTGLIYNCPIKSPGGCDGLLSANTEPDVANNDRRLFDGDCEFLYHSSSLSLSYAIM